jgi:hypothetical protein
MEIIKPAEIKKIKEARELLTKFQIRLWEVEQALDDLSRATEIAQYSRQYEVVESFRTKAEEVLEDRLTVLEKDMSDFKVTIVETTKEGWEQGNELTKDHKLDKRKHNITSVIEEGETKESKTT